MSEDMLASKFLNIFSKINEKDPPDTMIEGVVKTLDPISIEIYQGIILEESQLFLGQMCRPHKVKIPHTHEYNGTTEYASATSLGSDPTLTQKGDLSIVTTGQATTTVTEVSGHCHDIKDQVTEDVHKEGSDYEEYVVLEIEPKLKVGDKVLMFAFNNYQKFYVAERIEEEE